MKKILLKSAVLLMAISSLNSVTTINAFDSVDYSSFMAKLINEGSKFENKETYLSNQLVQEKIHETMELTKSWDKDQSNNLRRRSTKEIQAEIELQVAGNLPVYVVQPGDQLITLSEAVANSSIDLAELNDLVEGEDLIVGDILLGVLPTEQENAIVILDEVNDNSIQKAVELLGNQTNVLFVSQDEVNQLIDKNDSEVNVSDESTDDKVDDMEDLSTEKPQTNVTEPENEKPNESDNQVTDENDDQDIAEEQLEAYYKNLLSEDFDWDTFVDLDSDNDGIPDYIEIFTLGFNPLSSDSFGDGINDSDRDPDEDGLTIREELSLGTNIYYGDTDYDGISDYDEIFVHNTNPLLEDSDNDGVRDGWEISHGYNPLEFNEVFEVVAKATTDTVTATVKSILSGKQVETLRVDAMPSNLLINPLVPGYIAPAFDFNVSGTFEEAEIAFDLSNIEPTKDWNPTIYHFNEEKQLLEKVDTKYENGVASAIVNHFSKYIPLANPIVWDTDLRKPDETSIDSGINLSFVLDDSGSMDYNDRENRRVSVTKDILSKLDKNKDNSSIISFAGSANVLYPQGNDFVLAANKLKELKNSWTGTNITQGIMTSLRNIDIEKYPNNSYIILLTDGEDTVNKKGYQEIIDQAKNKNIKIYTINLVGGNKDNLQLLATQTGGRYFKAENADVLNEIYTNIGRETIDFSRDSNGDGISDYYTHMIIGDKLVTGTGIPISSFFDVEKFKNSIDYDGDGIKNGDELKVVYDDEENITYLKMYSNPFSKDTDMDGIEDGRETDSSVRVFDVDPYKHLLIFSDAAYGKRAPEKIIQMIHAFSNGTKEEVYKEIHNSVNSSDDFNPVLGNWVIKESVLDGGHFLLPGFSLGFSAGTYIADNNLVISFKGSSDIADWIGNLFNWGVLGSHYQAELAKNYVKNISKEFGLENNDYNVYVTGHSLGGYLAQVGSAALIDNNIKLSGLSYFNGLGQNLRFTNLHELESDHLDIFNNVAGGLEALREMLSDTPYYELIDNKAKFLMWLTSTGLVNLGNSASILETLQTELDSDSNFEINNYRIEEDLVSKFGTHVVDNPALIPSPLFEVIDKDDFILHKGKGRMNLAVHGLSEFILDLRKNGEIYDVTAFEDFKDSDYYDDALNLINALLEEQKEIEPTTNYSCPVQATSENEVNIPDLYTEVQTEDIDVVSTEIEIESHSEEVYNTSTEITKDNSDDDVLIDDIELNNTIIGEIDTSVLELTSEVIDTELPEEAFAN